MLDLYMAVYWECTYLHYAAVKFGGIDERE